MVDEVAPDDADDVLGLKLLGSSTITGLLCAEAAELADDVEDTSGDATGPWLVDPVAAATDPPLLDAATAALTLFKDAKVCFEKTELRDGTLKAATAFPEFPDDRAAADADAPALAVEAPTVPARPGLAPAEADAPEFADATEDNNDPGLNPADAPEVADVDPVDPVAEGLNAVEAPELAEAPADPTVPGTATADAPELADEPTDPAVPGLLPTNDPDVAEEDPSDPKNIGLNPDDAPEVAVDPAEEAPVFKPKPA